MSFKKFPQPNLKEWKPDPDGFDWENDRLLIWMSTATKLIAAWSSDDPEKGLLMLAPEAVPEHIALYFQDVGGAPGLPYLRQMEDGSLKLTRYDGTFHLTGHILNIVPVRRGERRHSDEIKGYSYPYNPPRSVHNY